MYGFSTIIICTFFLFFSWRFYNNEKKTISIVLLLLAGIILRIFVASDFYLHAWDERYNVLVAKNLMNHPLIPTLYDNPILPYNYQDWTSNHIWLHKQPFPLWTMAAAMKLFGINEIAARIPSILLSTIGIYLTYEIGKYICNNKAGYISAFLYAINGLIIELTGGRVATDHIDIFFLFFIELGVFLSILYIKKQNSIYNILVGISIGLAILSKWLPALIIIPIWLTIVFNSKVVSKKIIFQQFLIIVFFCSIIFLPWQIYIFNAFPLEAKWEGSFNLKHITEPLEGNTGPFYYFLNCIRRNYGELIYLPLIWFFYQFYLDRTNLKRLALIIWFLIPFFFFSIAKTKMQGYILFTSPALFIITAEYYTHIENSISKFNNKWLYKIILILLIALPLRYTIERVKPFTKQDRNPIWAKKLKDLNVHNYKNGIIFNYDKPIEAMFYTNCTAYETTPIFTEINKLLSNGYTIIINDNASISNEIRNIQNSNLHFINLK